jgi:hypothetical protein
MTEYARFGLVFTKTRVYKFGHRNQESIPSLVESIPRNRFLSFINVYKYGLEKCTYWRGELTV